MHNAGRLLVLSDVHLSTELNAELSGALCDLVAAHRGTEIVFNGDLFEFSALVDDDAHRMWERLRSTHHEVLTSLRAHVQAGGRVTLVAGNHDAALTAVADEVVECLGGPASVSVCPWFVRRGSVHIEHGHMWDPDNAPLHPLADWSRATEPIGIALMRRFVASNDVRVFAHAHETTPVAAIARALRIFRWRTPWLLARYFGTAAALCYEAARRQGQARAAQTLGGARLLELAYAEGIEASQLDSVLAIAPVPTHAHFMPTFMRLYWDRVLASAAALSAGATAALGAAPLALGVFGLSSAYLASGALRRRSRSTGPVRALREASELVAAALGVQLVVFGHTHVPECSGRYVNLGSFGYPQAQGRPFVTIEQAEVGPVVQQHHWPVRAAAAVEA